MPCEGHLDIIYRIFWYLKKAEPSQIIFDPSRIDIDERLFNIVSVDEWKDFYIDPTKPIPMHAHKPRGLLVKVS